MKDGASFQPNRSKIGPAMTKLQPIYQWEVACDSSDYHVERKRSLGLRLSQKYLKWGQKRLSYGQFTEGRFGDLREYHARCKGSIRASFEPKRSKIGLEMAEYYQLAKERLREAVGH